MTGEIDYAAGVLGSRTAAELATSWLSEGEMPFNQTHGHEAAWWWPDNNWHDDVPESVKDITTINQERGHSSIQMVSHSLLSIDGKLSAWADSRPSGDDIINNSVVLTPS